MTRPMMGFGLQNQEETHRREFESPPGYHTPRSNIPGAGLCVACAGPVGFEPEQVHILQGIVLTMPAKMDVMFQKVKAREEAARSRRPAARERDERRDRGNNINREDKVLPPNQDPRRQTMSRRTRSLRRTTRH